MKQQSGVVPTLQPGLVTSPTESRCTPQSHSGLMSLLLQHGYKTKIKLTQCIISKQQTWFKFTLASSNQRRPFSDCQT